jgi:hypothetical protein
MHLADHCSAKNGVISNMQAPCMHAGLFADGACDCLLLPPPLLLLLLLL